MRLSLSELALHQGAPCADGYLACPSPRSDEYVCDHICGLILRQAVRDAGLPFHYTLYQICHTPQGHSQGVTTEAAAHDPLLRLYGVRLELRNPRPLRDPRGGSAQGGSMAIAC